MGHWIFRYRWPMAVTLIVVVLLVAAGTILAQPPVPHAVMEGDDCLSCHQAGVGGAPRLAWDHLGRNNEDCARCHEVSGAPAGEIPHPLVGRDDCLSCHRQGVGTTPMLGGSHVDYTNEECGQCHFPSAAAAESTPIPTEPAPIPEVGHIPTGESSCVACHRLIFTDEEHALFTGQPIGDAQAGAVLFAQVCASCHGEDGTTPVGDEGAVINAEAYWSTHDDAGILQDIGAGSHGEMTAFAEDYGGPISWEQILDVAAFVRSWGPMAALPVGLDAAGEPTYASTIGPLLTERCGACHGDSAGLTVTDYASLMAGSSSGPVVVPGDPDGSRLVEVQRGEHYTQLSEVELDRLIEWIANGATEQ
jgi:mono/diheme cytochrome c family protein